MRAFWGVTRTNDLAHNIRSFINSYDLLIAYCNSITWIFTVSENRNDTVI